MIYHKMKLKWNLILGVISGCDFIFGLLWHFITKWGSYFITNCDKTLLQNATAFLLQNATALLQNVNTVQHPKETQMGDILNRLEW